MRLAGAGVTFISQSAATTDVRAAPRTKTRNAALDRTRTFLTLVVLFHHAVIPYTYFGHTDPKFFIGFDMVVIATDSFFMAMFFLLSGLFVWPGLVRKGPWRYLLDRLLRLGLPFAIGALTIVPIAYYALSQRHQPEVSFADFWWKTVTVGPWPSGPIWFLWVLLGLDVIASLLYVISPKALDPINRLSLRAREEPAKFVLVMFAATAVLYIPGRIYFGAGNWFEFGPFSVQHGRVLFYASYFIFGAGIGVQGLNGGLLAADGKLAKGNWIWIPTVLIPYCCMWGLVYIKREILGNPMQLPYWYEGIYGFFFAWFSMAVVFGMLGFFLRFERAGRSMLDPMQSDAFGMFLVHYPIILWLQYWMFDFDLPAIAKVLIAFALTVFLSWGATMLLRKIPGAKHVL